MVGIIGRLGEKRRERGAQSWIGRALEMRAQRMSIRSIEENVESERRGAPFENTRREPRHVLARERPAAGAGDAGRVDIDDQYAVALWRARRGSLNRVDRALAQHARDAAEIGRPERCEDQRAEAADSRRRCQKAFEVAAQVDHACGSGVWRRLAG